jgi:hypothetical protein
MAAFLVIGRRPAPVLDQEKCEVLGGVRKVLVGIEGPENRITCNPRIEAFHQQPEGLLPTGGLVNVAP